MAIAVAQENPAHPDNPMLILMNAVTIGAGATQYSDVIDVANAKGIAVMSTVDQAHSRQVQASADGVTWCNVVSGGLLPSSMSFTGAAGSAVCQVFPPCGARFVRVSVTNNGGGNATATVWATASY